MGRDARAHAGTALPVEKKEFENVGGSKYCRLFFSASGRKTRVRHRVRMNGPTFSSSFDVTGKGCIVCKNKTRRASDVIKVLST